MSKILIVEDDEVIAQAMVAHLAAAGHEPRWVAKGEQGLAALRFEPPDVVVLDLMLPQRDGWSVIEDARSEGIGTPITSSARAAPSTTACMRSTSGGRLHGQAVLDERARGARPGGGTARVRRPSRREGNRSRSRNCGSIRARSRPSSTGRAWADAHRVKLLYQLALDRGRVVTRDELLQKLWGRRESHRDRTVDLHPPAPGQDRPPRLATHVHPDQVRRRLQARARTEGLAEREQHDPGRDEDCTGEPRGTDALVQKDRGQRGRHHDARLAHRRDGRRRRVPEGEEYGRYAAAERTPTSTFTGDERRAHAAQPDERRVDRAPAGSRIRNAYENAFACWMP